MVVVAAAEAAAARWWRSELTAICIRVSAAAPTKVVFHHLSPFLTPETTRFLVFVAMPLA